VLTLRQTHGRPFEVQAHSFCREEINRSGQNQLSVTKESELAVLGLFLTICFSEHPPSLFLLLKK